MPCPFTSPKMFWAGPNFLCQTKNTFTYCGSHKHFVPDKKGFAFSKIGFYAGTKVFEEALNAVKYLGWPKKFGLAQKRFGTCKRTRNFKSMNVLCQSKFYEPAQKFDCI